jgi:hypothetical protein
MANHSGPIREFLTRNEIIFKTVAATALSLMALIVSAGSYLQRESKYPL